MTSLQQQDFGEHQGEAVSLFTLTNRQGLRLVVTNYGCIITQLWVPDRHGQLADIVLGFDRLADYQAGHPFFGAIAGRCANRIANGEFVLNGKTYRLATNERSTGQHLHGGVKGFDKYVWRAQPDGDGVIFSRTSADGEEGYPGTLQVQHRIGLRDDNTLTLAFHYKSDAVTPVNLVNHSYYNLAGHQQDIRQQQLSIAADFYTPVNETTMLPTGEIHQVAGSAFDFRQPRLLVEAMAQRPDEDFDVNYVLRKNQVLHHNPASPDVQLAAELYHPASGRVMTVLTDRPGVQLYNGFKLSDKPWSGKQQQRYQAFSGLCLETQAFPDALHQGHFPSILALPDQQYHSYTEHRFSLREA